MIRHFITEEKSSNHWSFFECLNEVVLDLGCGKWDVKTLEETSPVYFIEKGATRVIGVDYREDDIKYYNEHLSGDSRYTFIYKNMQKPTDVLELFKQYEITVLKCDIEGGEEYVLLDLNKEQMKGINKVGIEFHSKQLFHDILMKMLEWEFEIKVFSSFGLNEMNSSRDNMGVLYGVR